MKNRWILPLALILFLGSVSSQNSTNSTTDDTCDSDRCLALVAEIGPIIRTHTEVKPKSEVLKKMNNLCTEIKSCFKAATCKKGKHTYESMRDACDHLELMTGNVQPCLKKFYSAVYHEKYNCTADKKYLSTLTTPFGSMQLFSRVGTCLNLFILCCTHECWNQIITSGDKWVMYYHNRQQAKWVDKGTQPPDVPKREIHVQNGILSVMWSTKKWSNGSF
ncbi:hypothetical protein B9Z55_006967 [Caenorhabditis nigoni]|uniref:T20D4.11-like domain-containing protein n=1 Tax=Caenorhabditis nigoni TaxID=1611254 RepID=A0A2G5V857_9PELO|nr:hypothetical protein B9Z55_006967 [Caenorhabditis nigoni]